MHIDLLKKIRFKPEYSILAMMIMVIVMFIVPLPTSLIDFLIGVNMTIALSIFLGSFYLKNILEFSTFPSILLISTLFRLAISISTSRLILMNADAGDIITSFGQFVIGDNLIVGFVIFFIITIVQFIVITKGAERIAEVSARFSLDAMPGKQMSIDADLKAGVLDEAGVLEKRRNLETESQLYGSLDGAMKFIKGDAIASIIIIFVNLIGGISVGTLQHSMKISEAMSIYAILTIGDALVAQIPALLISISGGFIVTRVNNSEEKNLGEKVIRDLFANKFTLLLTACLSLLLAMLPGFPSWVFIGLAIMFLAIYYKAWRENKSTGSNPDGKNSGEDKNYSHNKGSAHIDGEYISETIPVILTFCQDYRSELDNYQLSSLLKKRFFIEYGVTLPDIHIAYAPASECRSMNVTINEIFAASYTIIPGMEKILMRGDELQVIDNSVISVSHHDEVSYWVPDGNKERANKLGYYTKSAVDEIYSCISTLLSRNITEFFGIQEAKTLLDSLETKYPDLLKECYRNATVQRISEVFQRLLQERISIRNMKLIMESLVQWSSKEKDPVMLVEHVRSALSRYISNRFSYNGIIRALMLDYSVEEKIRTGIRQSSSGSFINLSPSEADSILEEIGGYLSAKEIVSRDVVFLVPVDIRRFFKKIIESRYPELDVLSLGEISDGIDVNVIHTFSIDF
ncbi:EscV/YscV/HrcV family type III secretion system export apparatus protein [Hafnia paralvei]|uniref:EscV/YscV/HrcV family type III secretion system export apparatus protein n=1 Tax=Hafnia paralvei TaxID=546367 RepID=UPI00300D12C7